MFKAVILGAAAMSLTVAANSNALVIDFEEIPNPGTEIVYSGYSLDTQGFNFLNSKADSDSILHWGAESIYNADPKGVTYSHNYLWTITTVTEINGNLFDLTSLDIGNIYNNRPHVQAFHFTGMTGGGTFLSRDFTSDGLSGLETVTLNWLGLQYFTFTEGADSGFLQADNFVISQGTGPGGPIPEPNTMLLFGASLAGLAGVSRRKK